MLIINIFLNILIIIFSVLMMEIIAIFTHKYIMHGPGWALHKSHHEKHNNLFELNDIYAILFSFPSAYLIIYGLINAAYYLFSIGFGMLIYGLIYFFIHDIIVHKRVKSKFKLNSLYINNIRKAHLIHHSSKKKDNAKNFGFISY